MKHKKLALNLLKVILTGVILYFLGRQVYRHWAEIKGYDWDVNFAWLGLSIVCGLAALFTFSWSWRKIIGAFGYRVSPAEAFKISYLSDMGRYIPGKVWQLVGILYLTSKKGIPAESAGASFVMFQMFTIPAAFLVFTLAGNLEPTIMVDQVRLLGQKSAYLIGAGMLCVSGVVIFYPSPLLRLGNAVLRRLKRPEITFQLDKMVALQTFIGYVLAWVMYGLAFWLLLRAVAPDAAPNLVAAVGIYCVSYQIGYLVLFAPGGFGPREIVMGMLLAPFLGPIAPAVAILARLWSIVVEVIAALIALRIRM